MKDPIDRIAWRDARTLSGNDYNPNVVYTPELKLLELSIIRQGWVQPVLVLADGTIIDGFHRATLAATSKPLIARYAYDVPCVTLDLSRPEAMLLTIRINRAKGTHIAFRLSTIVRELVDVHGLTPQHIATDIGGTPTEVDLLYKQGVFEVRDIKNYRYSKAWYPAEQAAP